jgi:hypothetical protein
LTAFQCYRQAPSEIFEKQSIIQRRTQSPVASRWRRRAASYVLAKSVPLLFAAFHAIEAFGRTGENERARIAFRGQISDFNMGRQLDRWFSNPWQNGLGRRIGSLATP